MINVLVHIFVIIKRSVDFQKGISNEKSVEFIAIDSICPFLVQSWGERPRDDGLFRGAVCQNLLHAIKTATLHGNKRCRRLCLTITNKCFC